MTQDRRATPAWPERLAWWAAPAAVLFAAAAACGAAYVVTGNVRHFPAGAGRGLKVVGPAAFRNASDVKALYQDGIVGRERTRCAIRREHDPGRTCQTGPAPLQ